MDFIKSMTLCASIRARRGRAGRCDRLLLLLADIVKLHTIRGLGYGGGVTYFLLCLLFIFGDDDAGDVTIAL